MYELMDARDHGQNPTRPLIICENWRGDRRLIFAFLPDDRPFAEQVLGGLNEMIQAKAEDASYA